MFLTLRSPATRDFRSLIGRAVFARLELLEFVLLLLPLAIEEDCLAEAISSQVASNQIKETSHKNLNKNAAHILRFHEITVKKRQMDRVQNGCPAIACAKLD